MPKQSAFQVPFLIIFNITSELYIKIGKKMLTLQIK